MLLQVSGSRLVACVCGQKESERVHMCICGGGGRGNKREMS